MTNQSVQLVSLTRRYIIEEMLARADVPAERLERYLYPEHELRQFTTLNEIYELMLLHGQNRGTGGAAMKRVFGTQFDPTKDQSHRWLEHTRQLLFDFDPVKVADNYTPYSLFARLEHEPYNEAWPTIPVYGFCRLILDAAWYFKNNFELAEQFYAHFEEAAASENPEKIAQEELGIITGYGEALPLDFLKELGFTNYVKPDVHTNKLCNLLNLIDPAIKSENAATVAALKRVATEAGVTPYSVDRMFWLIGSGNFFRDEAAQKKWNIRSKADSRRSAFVAYVRENGFSV